jgi:hypothetical protein
MSDAAASPDLEPRRGLSDVARGHRPPPVGVVTDEGRCVRCGLDFASHLGHTTVCPALDPAYRALAEALMHTREAVAHLMIGVKYGSPGGAQAAEYCANAMVRSERAQLQMLVK